MGPVAIDSPRSNRELPQAGRWYRGWHVTTQMIVLARYGEPAQQSVFAEQIEIWQHLLVPGTSRIVTASAEPHKRPYLAVELLGYPLNREAQKGGRIEERLRLRWAVELCALLTALAQQGAVLPDAELNRFNTDQEGRLWLVDLWGLRRDEPAAALLANCICARKSCQQLVMLAPCYSLPVAAHERLENETDLTQLARIFDS